MPRIIGDFQNTKQLCICFGKRLRSVREDLGLTREIAAEKIGISPQHLSFLENGNRAPSISTLIIISNAFHITPNDLLLDSIDITNQSKIRNDMWTCMLSELSTDDQQHMEELIRLELQFLKKGQK